MSDWSTRTEEFEADRKAVAQLYPGPQYRKVLGWLHAALRPRTYLEIGIRAGESLVLTRPETRVVGVDPTPRITVEIPERATIEAMTSDDFFASGLAAEHFGASGIDLAFIDGSHLAEDVLKDFENTLPLMTEAGVILLHDVAPLRAAVAERERRTFMWTGDVWKAALAIVSCWPHLDARIVRCAPSGLMALRIGGDRAPRHTAADKLASLMPRAYGDHVIEAFGRCAVVANEEQAILDVYGRGGGDS